MFQIEQWIIRRRDDRKIVKVTCPECKNEYALDHEIGVDGIVTPSLDCPTKDCGFHEMVQLRGWQPDDNS